MKVSSIIGKLIAGLNRPTINNDDVNGTVSPYGNGVKLEAIGQVELVPYSANSTAKDTSRAKRITFALLSLILKGNCWKYRIKAVLK